MNTNDAPIVLLDGEAPVITGNYTENFGEVVIVPHIQVIDTDPNAQITRYGDRVLSSGIYYAHDCYCSPLFLLYIIEYADISRCLYICISILLPSVGMHMHTALDSA